MGLLEPSEYDWEGVEGHLSSLADRLMADHRLLDLPPGRSVQELSINRWKPVKHFPTDPKTSKLSIAAYETVEIDLPRSVLLEIWEVAQEQGVPAGQVVNGILSGVFNSGVLKPGWALKSI